jgi:hypothetical protein
MNVTLLYRCDPGVFISGVLVGDGARLFRDVVGGNVGDFTGLRLGGDRSGSEVNDAGAAMALCNEPSVTLFDIDDRTVAGHNAPEVYFGVSVQVGVRWESRGEVDFAGVGAGFFLP